MSFKRNAVIASLAAAAALTLAPVSHADGYDPGCNDVRWGFLGSSRRLICDGPVQPDGSWMRSREFYIPAHQVPLRTTCSGSYSVTCTTTGGYFKDEVSDGIEVYRVTPETVLADEPGHLAEGAV
ncbi:hypothetical protein I5H01_gp032 [Mycobacterium phage MarkPhew]|uniref:CDGP domain-containing protein n=1 Tax=Mycobacterium phage MarkPhew TaxID=2725625 RepID=A0A6M3SWL8_9CAUD|nr:hypothetical protein I5H01_gp032 [Mycobacterium phage MarkPhew]QJD50375.1 hypothetical protein SEA_MARKPHEW_75 [Mycobacterium phage MarkPhew]